MESEHKNKRNRKNMRLIVRNNSLLLSEPTTVAEKTFIDNLHTIAKGGWGKSVEFNVATMANGEETTHASLSLVIPPEFEDDLTGTGGVVKKESRCQHCGGPHH